MEDDIDTPASRMIRAMSIVSSTVNPSKEREERKPEPEQEMRTYGAVKFENLTSYFRAGSPWFCILVMILFFFGAQVCASYGDYWIANWVITEELRYPAEGVEPKEPNDSFFRLSRETYIYVYAFILSSAVFVTLTRSFIFFTICMRASIRLHDKMFQRITHAPMKFFNTNSSGAILNRFSKDMGSVDEALPAAFIDFAQITLTLIGAMIVISYVSYWMIIPTVTSCALFYFMRVYYIRTSRSLKRLEGLTKTPIFAHLQASLQGLTTIRAFSAQKILISEFDIHQDVHSSVWFMIIGTSRGFGLYLDIVCVAYITVVTYFFLFYGGGERAGGYTGLAITQVLGLIGMFQWGMRQSAELQNELTSVERIIEYCNIEQEAPFHSPNMRGPPKEWPVNPSIKFVNLSMQYSPKEPPVLHALNVTINAREKIGIVGRTGAGKSSLITALFRLAEIEGSILIDNVNTKYIGLHELRRILSIIPQEPVLFTGTMRYNLDPFDEYADYILYQALNTVELDDSVSPEMGGLNSRITKDGENFSVGERQLVSYQIQYRIL